MTLPYMSIAVIAVITAVAPVPAPYLKMLLDVSYGILALIFFASISIAVSLQPAFAEPVSNIFNAEFSIQPLGEYP